LEEINKSELGYTAHGRYWNRTLYSESKITYRCANPLGNFGFDAYGNGD